MITVFIADDHPLVRKGLREILLGEGGLQIVGEAATTQEVLDTIRVSRPDVLLTDLSMPGNSALTMIEDITRQYPNVAILVVTMHPEERFAVRALRAGAAGYLTKDSDPADIVRAVRMLAEGKKYITATLAEKLAQELGRDSHRPLHELLSNREFQIMRMLAQGTSAREIADKLSISIHTVNTYKARIMDKMNMKSVTELTLYAIENHLIE